jgi:hypothetical protein
MAKHSLHILELAKRGAEVRLGELADELKMLTVSFPHLRDSFDKDELPVSFILKKGARRAAKRQAGGHRRTMSAAARKAISKRMKKSWVERRKAAAKQAGAKT